MQDENNMVEKKSRELSGTEQTDGGTGKREGEKGPENTLSNG